MARVHHLGTPPVSRSTQTQKISTNWLGSLGNALKTFGTTWGNIQMQQMKNDSAMEIALAKEGWSTVGGTGMGGGSQGSQQVNMGAWSGQGGYTGFPQGQFSTQPASQATPTPNTQVPISRLMQPDVQQDAIAARHLNTRVPAKSLRGGQRFEYIKKNGKLYRRKKPLTLEQKEAIKSRYNIMEKMAAAKIEEGVNARELKEEQERNKVTIINKLTGETKRVDGTTAALMATTQPTIWATEKSIMEKATRTAQLEDKRNVAKLKSQLSNKQLNVLGKSVGVDLTGDLSKLSPEDATRVANKIKELRKAGADKIQIGVEKFDIQKEVTAGGLRTELVDNKDDKNVYATKAPLYNKLNKNNEVAYYETGVLDEEVKIVKLSSEAIKAGWTPKMIQERATKSGMTVENIMKKIGILK